MRSYRYRYELTVIMEPAKQDPGASRRLPVWVVTKRGANCLATQQITVNVSTECYHSFKSIYDELNRDADRFELFARSVVESSFTIYMEKMYVVCALRYQLWVCPASMQDRLLT
jgi:hypothetical protein